MLRYGLYIIHFNLVSLTFIFASNFELFVTIALGLSAVNSQYFNFVLCKLLTQFNKFFNFIITKYCIDDGLKIDTILVFSAFLKTEKQAIFRAPPQTSLKDNPSHPLGQFVTQTSFGP